MGRIVVSVAVSADGFTEGRGGDISVMPLDESFNVHNAELVRTATTLLYGGTTYRQMVGYWPGVPSDPNASEAEQVIAGRMADGIAIVAVSDSLTDDDTGPWRAQTTIVPRAQANSAVEALRRADGDTVVFGSRTVWAQLLTDGLVDELYLLVGPKIVAGDTPAFSGVGETALQLLDVVRHPDSDNVVLHYAVPHA